MGLLGSRRSFLVIARRRSGALAAVVDPGSAGQPASVLAFVRADAASPAEAVAAVAAKFRAAGIRVPSRAVVIAPDVESRHVELPADPARPPARHELAEMIRWEVEPYLPAHDDAGHDDHAVTVGWQPGADGPPFNWSIAGARDAALRDWSQALATAGSSLVAAYPLVGCAAGAIPRGAPDRLVLDEHLDGGLVVRSVIERSFVVSRSAHAETELEDLAADAPRMVAGPAQATSSVTPFLTVAAGVDAGAAELASLAGAARHAAGVAPSSLCVCVRPAPRKGPSPIFLALCVAGGIAAFVIASERWLDRRLERVTRLTELSTRANNLETSRAVVAREFDDLERHERATPVDAATSQRAAALLDAVAGGAAAGIALEHARLERFAGVTLEGTATSSASAAAFRESLARALAASGLVATEATIRAGQGSTRASFRFRFRTGAAEVVR